MLHAFRFDGLEKLRDSRDSHLERARLGFLRSFLRNYYVRVRFTSWYRFVERFLDGLGLGRPKARDRIGRFLSHLALRFFCSSYRARWGYPPGARHVRAS